MRILITGSTGLLGRALRERLNPAHEVWGVSRRLAAGTRHVVCDLTDADAVARCARQAAPDVVIHTAAQSDVDRCTLQPAEAHTTNVAATEHVVAAAVAQGARLVHVSTDYVFDGLQGAPYAEDDAPQPVSEYGRTKLAAEQVVRQAAVPWLIIRPSTLFGPGRATFVDRVIRCAEAGEPVTAFADQTTSPSYAVDVAEAIARLLQAQATGVVHVANAGAASRPALARMMMELWGIAGVTVRAVPMASLQLPARRPVNSSLAIDRLRSLTGWVPRSWQDALRAYVSWKRRSLATSHA